MSTNIELTAFVTLNTKKALESSCPVNISEDGCHLTD